MLELRIVGVGLVQLGQDLLAFLLLTDRLVGELVAAPQPLAHHRPEVHLLGGLVPGFLDDKGFSHFLAQRHWSGLAPVAAVGPDSSSDSIRLTSSWSRPSTSKTLVMVPPARSLRAWWACFPARASTSSERFRSAFAVRAKRQTESARPLRASPAASALHGIAVDEPGQAGAAGTRPSCRPPRHAGPADRPECSPYPAARHLRAGKRPGSGVASGDPASRGVIKEGVLTKAREILPDTGNWSGSFTS